ncbi:MAG: 4Fe-4S dicluster domain-containing protein [Elusimicrobiota bacterium]
MKYPKMRELVEAVKSFISPPFTSKFPAVPHKPQRGFRGKPVPSEEYCIGCGACAELCPAAAIEVEDKAGITGQKPVRFMRWRYDLCVFCGLCEKGCTTKKGVVLSDEYDLAVFDRKQLVSKDIIRELLTCDSCGAVIGTKMQMLYVYKKLGPLAYGNYPVVASALENEKVAEFNAEKKVEPVLTDRTQVFHIKCSKCKRMALLHDDNYKRPGT